MKNTKAIFLSGIKVVFVQLIVDFLYFPIWWYSEGLINEAKKTKERLISTESKLGITVWLKNIFVPMFGQYDISGRLVSFFMRLFQVIARAFLLAVFSVFIALWFVCYLLLPIVLVFIFLYNLNLIEIL